jgi:hypothetical protein
LCSMFFETLKAVIDVQLWLRDRPDH